MIQTSPAIPISTNIFAKEANAPEAQVAITLWPQPCPTPLKASYSAKKATTGPFPVPFFTALKDVGRSQ